MSRVSVNVSGRLFEFNSDTLSLVQSGRLRTMVYDAMEVGQELKFTVDRSVDSFAAVLTYYETGKLHLPYNVCPNLFLDELAFWGISHEQLSDCCSYRLHSFLDEMETRWNFRQDGMVLEQKYLPINAMSSCLGLQRFRRKVWAIVDFQEKSIPAKIYYVVIITMIMLSILSLAMSTEPDLKRSLTTCEILEYLQHSDDPDYESVKEYFSETDCSGPDLSGVYENVTIEVDDGQGGTRTIVLEQLTVPANAFSVFEIVFVIYFTIDIVLRMFSCPSLIKYFLSILNIIDALALTTSYVLLIVLFVEREHQYKESWLHILKYFQILRALRLLRVVKTFRASQVLAYSIKENMKDLMILTLFLFLGLSTFSCLIYFAESRDNIASIPVGWYWSIITLTTVGYGDITPKTSAGRVIASVCAVLGVVLMAVTVPIFVNNFLSLYQFAIVDEYIQHKKKVERKKQLTDDKEMIAMDDGLKVVTDERDVYKYHDRKSHIGEAKDGDVSTTTSEAWK